MTTQTTPTPPRMTTQLRQTWKGLWLLGVAAVHTVFGVVVFQPQLQEIAQRGVFDSVGTDPMRGAVTWFVLFGALFALLGWAVLLVERHAALAPVPLRALGAGLLALTALGIVLMPASGFWLVLPPALALCLRPGR
ncbi:MAG: DUF6463 family protein [Acidovorax sp.]|nr:DUF6463 family protein [Acidovorax sp.]